MTEGDGELGEIVFENSTAPSHHTALMQQCCTRPPFANHLPENGTRSVSSCDDRSHLMTA